MALRTLLGCWWSQPIPFQLWQTHASGNLTGLPLEHEKRWEDLNPGLKHVIMNDDESAVFIRTYFSDDIADMFESLPLGVMRADFWRYAVLFVHGGFYGDMDTWCQRPIKDWLVQPGTKGGDAPRLVDHVGLQEPSWNSCRIVLGLENDAHFCQWAFASVPGHPFLRAILEMIIERMALGINIHNEHFVHSHTGPGVFSAAIGSELGLTASWNARQVLNAVRDDDVIAARARELGVCLFDTAFFNQLNLFNRFASQAGDGKWTWKSWTRSREALNDKDEKKG